MMPHGSGKNAPMLFPREYKSIMAILYFKVCGIVASFLRVSKY